MEFIFKLFQQNRVRIFKYYLMYVKYTLKTTSPEFYIIFFLIQFKSHITVIQCDLNAVEG